MTLSSPLLDRKSMDSLGMDYEKIKSAQRISIGGW